MKTEELNNLPEEVQDFTWGTISDFNYDLADRLSLTVGQFDFIGEIEDKILLKKYDVLDLPKYLEKIPGEFKGDIRELALEMAIKIFWPLQEYLGNVDRLILRLGAKVPKAVILKKKDVSKSVYLDNTFTGQVTVLLSRNPEFKDLFLTKDKILNKQGRLVAPTVQNWIEDYVHFLGAGNHDSLDRAKYISNNENAYKLPDNYKDNLRLLFLSYDEGRELFFDKSEGILRITEHKDRPRSVVSEEYSEFDLGRFLEVFFRSLKEIDSNLISSDIIMSEAENNINKVRDILWQAIGIGDKDKALGCLRVLLTKKSFDQMIKEDSRFKNILKRFIGVKYGQNMERALDENIDQLIVRRIFLEMILSEKLRLAEEDVYSTAFYLTNIIPGSGQVVYLDKRSKTFRWLEIQVVANKFSWVDKI